MIEQQDSFRYGFLSGWLANSHYEEMLSAPLTRELIPIAEAFKANMMRNRSLAALLPEIAYWTRLDAKLEECARYRLGRSIDLPGRVRGQLPPDEKFSKEYLKTKSEWFENSPKEKEAFTSQVWQDGGDLIKSYANLQKDYIGEGIEALMSSMLLELWASLEAFLTNTWVAAVNMMPNPLASNILGQDKSFPVQSLKDASFDVSKIMGTLMIRHNKVNMNSISGIKAAYAGAFLDQNPSEIFENYDPDVSNLEAIRNLFSHRSGIVDSKFINRIEKSSEILSPTIGKRLKINGDIVSFYTGRCVNFASDVFIFTDRWIGSR